MTAKKRQPAIVHEKTPEQRIAELQESRKNLRTALLALVPTHRDPARRCWCPISWKGVGHSRSCLLAREAVGNTEKGSTRTSEVEL